MLNNFRPRARSAVAAAWTAALLLLGGATALQGGAIVAVDEYGNGTITLESGTVYAIAGALLADPGPGGLDSTLTYDLQGPPSLEAGDVLALYGGQTLQLFRFNAADTGYYLYPASLIFYSSNRDGMDTLANTLSPPAGLYDNALYLDLSGHSIWAPILYTPAAGQPGYIDGFDVSYSFQVATPEPSAAQLLFSGLPLLFFARRAGRGHFIKTHE